MASELLLPSFLFRFSLSLKHRQADWPAGMPLDEDCRLLNFAALDDARIFADVRSAWSRRGLFFSVEVAGKKHPPWCRESRIPESDGLHVWIDTRDTKNIHRASRFCHHFVFLPCGGGHRLDQPIADQVLINRARENAYPVRPGVLRAQSAKRVNGYVLDCFVPADALTGFQPEESPHLGVFYAVADRELGVQTLAYSGEFPYQEDPSLWCTANLLDNMPDERIKTPRK
jgi:hypothetical protein